MQSSAEFNWEEPVIQHPEVIGDYLRKERERGWMLGPFHDLQLPPLHINRFGATPPADIAGIGLIWVVGESVLPRPDD